jgi:hypothetical protein
MGDFGAINLDVAGWLKGWENAANSVRNVAGGVSTVTQAAQMGLQQAQNPFQPSAADLFAQKYNTLAYVTPGGQQTLMLLVGGAAVLLLLSRKKARS